MLTWTSDTSHIGSNQVFDIDIPEKSEDIGYNISDAEDRRAVQVVLTSGEVDGWVMLQHPDLGELIR